MSEQNGQSANPAPQRPKLNLKPRDPSAAARLEAERAAAAAAKSPFGDAKPREVIIATRVGKSEEEILKEEVKKEKLHLRLSATQLEERRSCQAAVKEIEDQIAGEEDEAKKTVLAAELTAREAKLASLMERFAKATLETAMSGEAPRVSQMRRQQMEAAPPPPGPGGYGAPPAPYGGGAAGGAQYGQYQQRYNPTQQYAGPQGGRGGGRGGEYGRAGFDNYQPSGGAPRGGYGAPRGGRGGRGGGGGVPEWAREDYSTGGYPGGGGGVPPPAHLEQSGGGGYRHAPGGGYGDTSDAGFFDQPGGIGGGGGGGGARGRGRGRGRGRDTYGGGGGGSGGYYEGGGYSGGGYGGGRGVGGEIEFDTFSGQDRY